MSDDPQVFSPASTDLSVWFDQLAQSARARKTVYFVAEDSEISLLESFRAGREHRDTGGVYLLTSGTTGQPKPVFHSWSKLLTRPKAKAYTWLTFYPPYKMAGLQVALHSIVSGGHVFYEDINSLGVIYSVDSLALSPSMVPKIVSNAEFVGRYSHVEMISLGGEPVTAATINILRKQFPKAKVAHVYASTEAGVMATVKDGRPGLPLELFKGEDPRFSIGDSGELCFKSIGGTVLTGDLVEIRSGRAMFVGRTAERTVSVGGNFVSLDQLEAEIRDVTGVLAVKVSAKPSSLIQSLIMAEIVLDRSVIDIDSLRRIFSSKPPHLKPHRFREVMDMPISKSGKLSRN